MAEKIDAHHHLWRYSADEYGWIDEQIGELRRDFLPGDLVREMRAAGIDGAVTVQARQTLDETRWLLGLADTCENATDVGAGAASATDIDAAWRKVVSVRIALLMRSQDRASVIKKTGGNAYTLGEAPRIMAVMKPPADGRFRDVYETTIALRNRLTSF